VGFPSCVPNPNYPAFDGSFFNTEKARAFGVNSAFDARVTHRLHSTLVAGAQLDPSFQAGTDCIDWDRGFSNIAHIGNLFDQHYQDAIGYPALGYNYRVGVKYTWGGG
jgi:hypothetical protein